MFIDHYIIFITSILYHIHEIISHSRNSWSSSVKIIIPEFVIRAYIFKNILYITELFLLIIKSYSLPQYFGNLIIHKSKI